AGPGSPSHIAAAYFQNTIGASFQLVPYRGTPQVIQDLVAGPGDIVFDQGSSALPPVRAGQIKAFAATSQSRPRGGAAKTGGVGNSECRRSGLARLLHDVLVWPVGTEGYALWHHRKAQFSGGRDIG